MGPHQRLGLDDRFIDFFVRLEHLIPQIGFHLGYHLVRQPRARLEMDEVDVL